MNRWLHFWVRELISHVGVWLRDAGVGVRSLSGSLGVYLADFLSFFTAGPGHIVRWLGEGNRRYLVQGLPALLVLLTAAVSAGGVLLRSPAKQADSYEATAREEMQAGNYVAAGLAYERLCLLQPDLPEHRYDLARACQAQGEQQRALALMRGLAPARGPVGHGPAHLWLAKHLLNQRPETSQTLLAAELQLQRALQANPNSGDAHALLGWLWCLGGRHAEAEPHLLACVDEQPQYAVLLAAISSGRGDRAKACAWAERAEPVFRKQLQADPEDYGARINLADCAALAGNYPAAVEILRQGRARPGGERYRSDLAKIYAAWVNSLGGETAQDKSQRLSLIEQGLAEQPQDIKLLRLLVKAGQGDGAEAAQARALVQSLLESGKASADLHWVLANEEMKADKPDLARQHFESAHRLDAANAIVANNLAWLVATTEPIDLPRALELSDAAVRGLPRDMRMRQSRGRILAMMGRWQEALVDLEACLSAFPKDANLHKSLAEVYGKLNMPAMAARHSRLAEK